VAFSFSLLNALVTPVENAQPVSPAAKEGKLPRSACARTAPGAMPKEGVGLIMAEKKWKQQFICCSKLQTVHYWEVAKSVLK